MFLEFVNNNVSKQLKRICLAQLFMNGTDLIPPDTGFFQHKDKDTVKLGSNVREC